MPYNMVRIHYSEVAPLKVDGPLLEMTFFNLGTESQLWEGDPGRAGSLPSQNNSIH